MSEEALKTIWIITDETPEVSLPEGARDGTRDTGVRIGQPKTPQVPGVRRVPVPLEKLKREMTDFLQVVGELFSEAERRNSGMQLDEIELSVKINGEGEVSLFGIAGTKAGGEGGITLKFKRKDSQ
jgi:hypothetical protein